MIVELQRTTPVPAVVPCDLCGKETDQRYKTADGRLFAICPDCCLVSECKLDICEQCGGEGIMLSGAKLESEEVFNKLDTPCPACNGGGMRLVS